MKFFNLVVRYLLLIIFLCGCVTHSSSPQWQVNTGDRSSLAFSGKGAAAGMMMDAYLGGAGIAIGIAIDEGIAKNIAENLNRSVGGFNIVSMVESHLSRKYPSYYFFNHYNKPTQVIIETYGFHTFSGEGDKATAWLKIHFIRNGNDTVINYPTDFDKPKTAELNDIKTNSELAYHMLNDAVEMVVARDGL